MGDPAEHRQLLRIKVEGYLNLVRIHRELEQRAATLLTEAGIEGMTLAQATALMVLVQEGAAITASRLAGLLNVSAVTVGRFVRSLEQGRWIRRRPDPGDARAMLLSPTRKTHSTLDRFFAVTDRLMDDAYGALAADALAPLVANLAIIRKNLYAASDKPDTEPQVML